MVGDGNDKPGNDLSDALLLYMQHMDAGLLQILLCYVGGAKGVLPCNSQSFLMS